jgi:hypothetical protein
VVPTYAAAVFLILSTRLTGIIVGYAARQFAATTGVRAYQVPAQLPPVPIPPPGMPATTPTPSTAGSATRSRRPSAA